MNNDAPSQTPDNDVPAQIPAPQPQPEQNATQPQFTTPVAFGTNGSQTSQGAWVSKDQYNELIEKANVQSKKSQNMTHLTRAFYVLLALGGLLTAILIIGNLVWPFEYHSKGNCSANFSSVSFYLMPFTHLLLFVAGIMGASISKWYIRLIGILLIVIVPLSFLFNGLAMLFQGMCGV
jgi:hypothetical protein